MRTEKKTTDHDSREEIDNNTAVLYLEGWMDTQSAPALAQALNELEDNVAHKQMKGEMILRNPSPEVREVLKMTGLDKRLHIEA